MSRYVGIIIQARMGSSRLPGKVMKLLNGRPLIELLLKRLSFVKGCNSVIVATTTDQKDDPLAEHCSSIGGMVFRGPEQDVLERYYLAAMSVGLDVIIRITGDCPLADPQMISEMISKFNILSVNGQADYMSNTKERRYPRGLDIEIFSFKALERAYFEAQKPYEREHVTPFIWENEDLFKIASYRGERDLSQYRLTVDTQEDLDLILAIENELTKKGIDIVNSTLEDVVRVLKEKPELVKINAGVSQKSHKDIDERAVVERSAVTGKKGKRPPLVLFRTNASARIGMGHLMRCYSVAEEMVGRGWDVSFIVEEERGSDRYSILRGLIKDIRVLPQGISRAMDLSVVSRTVRELQPMITVVDSYDVNQAYLQSIKAIGPPVAYIDDLAQIKGGMDLLINYNSGFSRSDYKHLKKTKFILGLKYCPLNKLVRQRREQMSSPPQQPDAVTEMLLTLGGGPHMKLLRSLLKVLRGEDWIKKVQITSQAPKGCSDKRFEFIGFKSDLPSIIARHPLAITAGGSTCYQLACLGVPSVILTIAKNQEKAVEGLHTLGVCINIGKAVPFKPAVFRKVLSDLAHDKKARQRMAKKAFKAVDHLGVKRMVDLIEEEYK